MDLAVRDLAQGFPFYDGVLTALGYRLERWYERKVGNWKRLGGPMRLTCEGHQWACTPTRASAVRIGKEDGNRSRALWF